jgi:hypothetical protein
VILAAKFADIATQYCLGFREVLFSKSRYRKRENLWFEQSPN